MGERICPEFSGKGWNCVLAHRQRGRPTQRLNNGRVKTPSKRNKARSIQTSFAKQSDSGNVVYSIRGCVVKFTGAMCVIEPNFVAIGRSVAEI